MFRVELDRSRGGDTGDEHVKDHVGLGVNQQGMEIDRSQTRLLQEFALDSLRRRLGWFDVARDEAPLTGESPECAAKQEHR